MGHVRGSPPEGSAPALARSPLLHDSFGADGIGSHAPPAQLPHALQNPLVAPGQAAPSVLSDAEMDEATQLAIALSLSEQSQPPPVPPVSTAATSPQHAVGAESGMAPLDIWGRPMGSPGAQAVGADPFPAACYDGRGATAAKPPVEVMEPSMSESDQLALALELSLQEAKAREEALAAERAMVLEADRALVLKLRRGRSGGLAAEGGEGGARSPHPSGGAAAGASDRRRRDGRSDGVLGGSGVGVLGGSGMVVSRTSRHHGGR